MCSLCKTSEILQVSFMCQSSVNQVSIKCQSSVNHVSIKCQSRVNQVSIRCQSSVIQVSITCQSSVNHASIKCQSVHHSLACRVGPAPRTVPRSTPNLDVYNYPYPSASCSTNTRAQFAVLLGPHLLESAPTPQDSLPVVPSRR